MSLKKEYLIYLFHNTHVERVISKSQDSRQGSVFFFIEKTDEHMNQFVFIYFWRASFQTAALFRGVYFIISLLLSF